MANERERYAFSFFKSRGYSDAAAAGIVGNLSHESGGLNTQAINRGDGNDGSDSIGIAQWNGDRARQLKLFASGRGTNIHDFDTQLAFVDHELQTTERSTYTRLQGVSTPQEGTAAFLGYERPGGYSASNPSASNGYADRLARAQNVAGDTTTAAPGQYQPGDRLPDGSIYAGGGGGESAVNPTDAGLSAGGAASRDIAAAIDKQTGGSLAAASTALSNLGALTSDLFGRGALILIGVVILGAGLAWLVLGSRAGDAIPQIAAVKRAARAI